MTLSTASPRAGGDGNSKDAQTERLRIRKAFWLSVLGLGLAAVLVVVLVAAGFDKASDITTIVGLFTSVLGTLVGAFFGLQAGSSGKDRADDRADQAEKRLEEGQRDVGILIGLSDPATLDKARLLAPHLFD